MSAQNHPPDMATPQTWPAWGVDTAVASGDSNRKINTDVWKCNVPAALVATVTDLRRARPHLPLPADLQLQLASCWLVGAP